MDRPRNSPTGRKWRLAAALRASTLNELTEAYNVGLATISRSTVGDP
jgi:hypothetical protein